MLLSARRESWEKFRARREKKKVRIEKCGSNRCLLERVCVCVCNWNAETIGKSRDLLLPDAVCFSFPVLPSSSPAAPEPGVLCVRHFLRLLDDVRQLDPGRLRPNDDALYAGRQDDHAVDRQRQLLRKLVQAADQGRKDGPDLEKSEKKLWSVVVPCPLPLSLPPPPGNCS